MTEAIVLSKVITGLATIRAIAEGGIDVTAVLFKSHNEPVNFSRCCRKVDLSSLDSEQGLVDWLIAYAKGLSDRPVVIPTSDELALTLARNRKQLSPHCRLWETSYEDLSRIINKNDLYELAEASNVNTIPSVVSPNLDQVKLWTLDHPGPYFLKPFYEGAEECKLQAKNLVIDTGEGLIEYVEHHGADALVIQRLIEGGDGFIFDSYGLCDRHGNILSIASHRRWHQQPANTGTTSLGEIPANPVGKNESELFENTSRLLQSIKYHGIFGIEWLQDKETGDLYLIDFNARPFTSIGHLASCGLNLPLLAYRELCGEDLSGIEQRPALKHKYWVDLLHDLWSFQDKKRNHELSWLAWFKALLLCRSYAYWDWRDPGPGVYRAYTIIEILLTSCLKKFTRQ